jgi:hypothetical protein
MQKKCNLAIIGEKACMALVLKDVLNDLRDVSDELAGLRFERKQVRFNIADIYRDLKHEKAHILSLTNSVVQNGLPIIKQI